MQLGPALLSACLLLEAAAVVVKVSLHHVEGARKKLIRIGNLTELKRIKDEMRIRRKLSQINTYSKMLNLVKQTQPLRDYYDAEYIAVVSIPDKLCSEKPFMCKKYCLDIKMCRIFGYSRCCSNSLHHVGVGKMIDTCKGHRKFDSSKSTTFKSSDKLYYVAYGETWGKVGVDNVVFEDTNSALTVPNVEFGRTTFLSSFFSGEVIDGILGLGFASLTEGEMIPPFVRAYQQKLVDRPVFTVYMSRNGNKRDTPGGQITFGGLDQDNCESLITYVPLSKSMFWQFVVSEITINKENSLQKNWQVISDTGTSYLVVPHDVMKLIVAKAQSIEFEGGAYAVDCNRTLTIDLKIHGKVFTMTEKQLYIKSENGMCWLALENSGSDMWILGDPWLRSYCNIHDMGHNRIGFAKPKNS